MTDLERLHLMQQDLEKTSKLLLMGLVALFATSCLLAVTAIAQLFQ